MKRKINVLLAVGFFCLLFVSGSLIAWTVDMRHRRVEHNRALFSAVERNDAKEVRLQLEQGADANARGSSHFHLLDYGRWILSGGRRTPVQSDTVLILAARQGNLETAKMLLDAGADVNARAAGEYTALLCAANGDGSAGHPGPIILLLAARGADVNAKTEDGTTAWSLGRYEDQTLQALNEVGARR